MQPKAYLLVFDGLADWEPVHALCEINQSGRFEVVTVGFSRDHVKTMGGVRIVPDITLDEVRPDDAGIFIMPGGDMWEQTSSAPLIELLHHLHATNVTIGAICGATLEIVRSGLTRTIRHTSNDQAWLKSVIPDYQDDARYVEALAVTDQNVITANGLGSVEFGREVIKQLGLYTDADAERWYEMFKHGVFHMLPSEGVA